MNDWRQYRNFTNGEHILAFADTSAGAKDYSAVQFVSRTKFDVPLVYHSKKMATEMTNELMPVLEKIYDITGVKVLVAYERNNGGVFEMERLASLNRRGKYDIFKMPTYGKWLDNEDAVKLGWDCVDPFTFVLMEDFTWKMAEDIEPGDKILGVDEFPPVPPTGKKYIHRKMNRQEVVAVKRFQALKYKIVAGGKEIFVSDNHPFLVKHSSGGPQWVEARNLKLGNKIYAIHEDAVEYDLDTLYEKGRLSGLLDADGYISCTNGKTGITAMFSQVKGALADECEVLFDVLGFKYRRKYVQHKAAERSHHQTMAYIGVGGGLDVTLLFQMVQPKRLIQRFLEKEMYRAFSDRNMLKLEVTTIENVGMGEVIGIETSGHTLITNGLISHNTNTATRPKMLSDLKDAVDKQVLTIYDRPTIDELFSFVIAKTSSSWKAQAERGAHDDLVMSLAGAWQLYQYAREYSGFNTSGTGPFAQYLKQAQSDINHDPHIGL